MAAADGLGAVRRVAQVVGQLEFDFDVAPTDRFAAPGGAGPYQPDEPAPLPSAYLDAVDDYLRRVDEGEPTGRGRMQQLHPAAPTCHTPGDGRFPCGACGG